MATFKNIKAIVTDIEGTTSSISFVKDVLFPFAYNNLSRYVFSNKDQSAVKSQLESVALTCDIPLENTEQIIQQLLHWIETDVKATPLKNLQGMIWQEGYENGEYQAHMYDDAVSLLTQWHQAGIPLFVYSSGSVLAQKLFFSHSCAGDLLSLFKDHFDTNVGHKQEVKSYLFIQNSLGIGAKNILFLSDIAEELDAAKRADFQTCHVIRDKITAASNSIENHPVVDSFQQITLEP